MENMDKGLTVPKWVLIVWPKMPQNLSAHFFAQAQKWWISRDTHHREYKGEWFGMMYLLGAIRRL